ncbi:MAG: hypothetical protein SA339_04310 [Methanomassiliicoccus sp.]|nr:hypothetical protein [Methanomassiliicoccus sp.]
MSRTDDAGMAEMRSRVQADIDRYRAMRRAVLSPAKYDGEFIVLTAALLIVSTLIMLTWYEALIVWAIVTFILYSFNYIVFFLPLTRHRGERREKRPLIPKRPIKEPLLFMLRYRRRFAVEVGLTMFLVGMVPLARSFFVLFGIGFVFTIIHGTLLGELPAGLTLNLIVQILVIMAYLLLVVIVSPQSQGFTKMARSLKYRILTARSKGRQAYIWAMVFAGSIVFVICVVAVGAILLPGKTLDLLIGFFQGNDISHILALAAILGAEFLIMRVLQSRASRQMALVLIDQRLQDLEQDCLQPLDALIDSDATRPTVDGRSYEELMCTYCPMAVYDVVETNIFGYLPVFLVVPVIDLLLDEEVLRYVGLPRDMEGRPILDRGRP